MSAIAGVASAAHAERVLVWPQSAEVDTSEAEAEVRAAGHEVLGFEPVRERLRAQGDRAEAAESEAIAGVERALADARTAYLEQRFDAMRATLDETADTARPFLAHPRNAATLWELQFQIGLAELSLRRADRAAARFSLALAIDPDRSPRRELYGPDVVRAFAEAADARSAIAARPARLDIEPRDARVIIDGTPVIDNSRPRSLHPGLHIILVSAPGYASRTLEIEIAARDPIEVALSTATGDALERIGSSWAAGALAPDSPSGRRAIADAAADLGATVALVIAVDRGQGNVTAQAIAKAAVTAPEQAATQAAAVRAVLARLDTGPEVGDAAPPDAGSSWLRSWWFWTAVGVVVVGAGVGYAASQGDETLLIHSPQP